MRRQKAIWIIAAMLTMVGGPGAPALPSGAGSTAKPTGGEFLPVQAQESPRDDLYRGIGVVTDIHPATGSLTINHEEIPGLMPAMEMMLRVDPRALSNGVRAGDKVEFWVEGKTFTIRDIRVIEHSK
jgi:Cu/Ag efflux protein CusF